MIRLTIIHEYHRGVTEKVFEIDVEDKDDIEFKWEHIETREERIARLQAKAKRLDEMLREMGVDL